MQINNEVFTLRSGEKLELSAQEPEDGCYLAVQLRSIEMPPGERHKGRPTDGVKVEQCAVLACERVQGKWQWQPIGMPSKESIGDYMIDVCHCEKDRWYFLKIIKAI